MSSWYLLAFSVVCLGGANWPEKGLHLLFFSMGGVSIQKCVQKTCLFLESTVNLSYYISCYAFEGKSLS